MHTNARDEALALPTEESARLALRTQQILAFETGVAKVADPLGGSWYVESLTDEIEAEAAAYMSRIRNLGGVLKAIERGFILKEIQESAYRYQRSVEAGEQVLVGVNRFQERVESPLEILRIGPGHRSRTDCPPPRTEEDPQQGQRTRISGRRPYRCRGCGEPDARLDCRGQGGSHDRRNL